MKRRLANLLFLFLLVCCPLSSLAAEVVFYDTDNVGTPVAMWDKDGRKVWEGEYYPFGEEFRETESPAANNKHFVGKEKDEETGLSYFGARSLDGTTGRFIIPDPVRAVDPFTSKTNSEILTNPQRLNRYVYGLNNPYRYVDPDGEWAEAIFVDGPSIAVGVHSLVNNLREGNYGSAALDAGGIIVDSAAALAPGVPGGVGLGIKASRAGNKGTDFFKGTKYTDKVKSQMKRGDFHSFPESVKAFQSEGKLSKITGGDGITQDKLEIPGSYKGFEGSFKFIKESNGKINHRQFKPKKND